MKRPSGHDISRKFGTDNGAAIPPNLIAVANTESNSYYLRYCRENGERAKTCDRIKQFDGLVGLYRGSGTGGLDCQSGRRTDDLCDHGNRHGSGLDILIIYNTKEITPPPTRNKELGITDGSFTF